MGIIMFVVTMKTSVLKVVDYSKHNAEE